jgi:hypothetical protein
MKEINKLPSLARKIMKERSKAELNDPVVLTACRKSIKRAKGAPIATDFSEVTH